MFNKFYVQFRGSKTLMVVETATKQGAWDMVVKDYGDKVYKVLTEQELFNIPDRHEYTLEAYKAPLEVYEHDQVTT